MGIMYTTHRLVVPIVLGVPLVLFGLFSIRWTRPAVQPIPWRVDLSPTSIVPGRQTVLTFSPRNAINGHLIPRMARTQPRCATVTITNTSLDYIDQRRACRISWGRYQLPYRFPAADDYVLFIHLAPAGATAAQYRLYLPLDPCTRTPGYNGPCLPFPPHLRGLERRRQKDDSGRTLTLLHPASISRAGSLRLAIRVSDRRGAPVHAVATRDGVALSLDSSVLVPLRRTTVEGRDGTFFYTATLPTPSIYRFFVTLRDRHRTLRSAFVVYLNPATHGNSP